MKRYPDDMILRDLSRKAVLLTGSARMETFRLICIDKSHIKILH
jgi:hypothetical protein